MLDAAAQEKVCKSCAVAKPLDAYYAWSGTSTLQPRCKECVRSYIQARRDANREAYNEQARGYAAKRRAGGEPRLPLTSEQKAAFRVKRRARQYGITFEQYNELLEAQGNVCGICKDPETTTYKGVIRALSVDHDHETGGVRGLLCFQCNVALGNFNDDPVRLRAALAYLDERQD